VAVGPVKIPPMATVFSKIIAGEIPARFVYSDERSVAFLTIEPLRPGHTLVVPRDEIDHWIDLPPDLAAHLFVVSQRVGQAIERAFRPRRIGVLIAGLEVPHAHLHLVPFDHMSELDLRKVDHNPDPADLDAAAERIRAELA
jgi:histidine triad (HIT) family protein